MSHLFDNYIINGPKIGPNNRDKHIEQEPEFFDTIWPGANCRHEFRVEHKKADISNLRIYYNQGSEIVLVKNLPDVIITERTFGSITYCVITYEISEYESLAFNLYNKNCGVQMELDLVGGEIEYSPIFKIKVEDNLFAQVQRQAMEGTDIKINVGVDNDTTELTSIEINGVKYKISKTLYTAGEEIKMSNETIVSPLEKQVEVSTDLNLATSEDIEDLFGGNSDANN